jgi:pimeloyl-ACP methyl ester carboxylesterase
VVTGAITGLGLEQTTVATQLGSIRAFVGGVGPPIVLLHGLSGGAATWIEVIAGLGSAYHVVAIDLPGHGGSAPPPRGASIGWYADAVAEAVTSLGVAPAFVAGHSFGGQIALRLVERHPDVVGGLLLIGPSGFVPLPGRTRVLAVLTTILRPGALAAPAGVRLAGRAWFRRLVFGPLLVSDAAALSPRVVQGFFAEMREHTDVRTARRSILGEPPVVFEHPPPRPAIVLWGARDAVVPVEHGVSLTRALGIQLRVVPDCGHLLIGERPDAVVDAISALAALARDGPDERL